MAENVELDASSSAMGEGGCRQKRGRRAEGRRGTTVNLRDWARTSKRDVIAIYLAARDPRVPWYAKVSAFAVAAYALSPIDLIPDFIPIVGYLDDFVIVPL